MSAVAEAAAELETALKTLESVAVYRDPGATLADPAVVIGPPALTWLTGCPGPDSARFLVYVVVQPDERAVEQLWDLVVEVAEAIDEKTGAVIIRADPAVYVSGGAQLPCYELQVEAGL